MKNYGFINSLGELKVIQNSIYKGDGYFVGITRNGTPYVYSGTESRRITKEEMSSYLQVTPEQADRIIKSRGKVQFDSSKDNGLAKAKPLESNGVKKLSLTKQVKVENMDTQLGREKSEAVASGLVDNEVESTEIYSGAVSLEQSKLKALSLKNQVKYMRNRLLWLEDNYVSKEQLMEIIQALVGEK